MTAILVIVVLWMALSVGVGWLLNYCTAVMSRPHKH